ncbi:MAG: translocation/assembly module TamB domain-containing protein [Rhodanobacteraceae bacterium]
MTPARKWLIGFAIGMGVLVVVFGILLAWLVYTPSGLRFTLNRAVGVLDGRLAYAHVEGTLHGPLTITGLRYRDADGERMSAARITLDLQPLDLLRGRLHVQQAVIDGLVVILKAASSESSAFSLQPPLTILLDDARLTHIDVLRDGQPLFVANSLDIAGTWSDDGLKIYRLALRSPSGRIDLNATLALAEGYRGNAHSTFTWLWNNTRYAGSIDGHSDGKLAHFKIALNAPVLAQATLTLRQGADDAWTMALDAPRFSTAPWLGDASSIKTVALSLHGAGDRHGGRITGRAQINEHVLLLDPAQFRLDGQTLRLNPLVLRSPDIRGALAAVGNVQLDAQPPRAVLDIAWARVQLPADLAGQALDTHGQIHLAGGIDQYSARGRLAIGPPGRLSELQVQLTGTPRQIALGTLRLQQANGNLDAHGTLRFDPQLAWDLDAKATHFDPGALFAGWNGALDFALTTRGALTARGPEATVKLDRLSGMLRKRSISGNANLKIASNYIVDGKLDVASGQSRIKVVGRGGARTDATVMLAVASLGDFLPDASGRLDGHFDLKGRWPELAVDGRLQGNALRYGSLDAESAQLNASIPDISRPGGNAALHLRGVALGGYRFDTVDLTASGNAAAHHARLAVRGAQLSGSLALQGHWLAREHRWNGVLSALEFTPQGLPEWRQEQPAQLEWRGGALSLSELCIDSGAPRLCVAAQRDARGALRAHYTLQRLPLQLLTALYATQTPLRADGLIEGSGTLTRSADGALGGDADLHSADGSIAYADQPDRPLLAWRNLRVTAQRQAGTQHISLDAALDHDSRIRGEATLSWPTQALSGNISIDLRSLAAIELLSPEVANVSGHANGAIALAGTLGAPRFSGRIVVSEFVAELPRAGLKLHDGEFVFSAGNAARLHIDGHVVSGDGTLYLIGDTGFSTSAPLSLRLRGSNVLGLDIPAARVIASPDLQLLRAQDRYTLTGKLLISRAEVNLDKLPGQGPAQASPDVVIVDAPPAAQDTQASLSINTDVEVTLGDKVHLVGMGLDAKVHGTLAVRDRPDRSTTARGTLLVDGSYKAYGQDLAIKNGRLLFAGTPIDNPGLDLRATRQIRADNVTAGLRVQGTAQKPVLTVYSDPAMEQSEALSYLVTGRPLSSLRSGEGDTLSAAAQALGTAAGNRLARQLGARLGVDEFGVSGSAALGGSAFTVGKYLSPRLYLSYGVGVFTPGQVITLRYKFNRFLEFEAENATTGNRAGLNYKIEK